jgi:hypothetical protein
MQVYARRDGRKLASEGPTLPYLPTCDIIANNTTVCPLFLAL